jgi:uncharacterized protein YbcI
VTDDIQSDRGSLASAISNLIVKTTAEYTGRGPTRARTTIDGDWIFVALGDTLTKGERTLAETGREHLIRNLRREFQDAMREDMVEGIRRLTGREVIAMLSDHHLDPDCAIEAFCLSPLSES